MLKLEIIFDQLTETALPVVLSLLLTSRFGTLRSIGFRGKKL
jgi:hypothetical protein